MSNRIYGRLAWTNLKNNKKTYIPYFLTAAMTVMMYDMVDALSVSPCIPQKNLKSLLGYGTVVTGIFAVIFLFYTNSFLIKRRKKEIGIYHILGMGKSHIGRMLAIETVVVAAASIGSGLVFGVIFSKFMYLVLLKIVNYDIGMEFEVSTNAIGDTLFLFAAIFAMTLFYNLFQIKFANPVELLYGGNHNEKEPRAKIGIALFGAMSLGAGYYLAVTTETPLAALGKFFAAVVLVILGTYALFTAGSITVLKALRKNKKFYYQTEHFYAVSGMLYRMKQNAVGLANICVLSTMVLVMVSSTIALYMGVEDILKVRFPREMRLGVGISSPDADRAVDAAVKEEAKKAGVKQASVMRYHGAALVSKKTESGFPLDERKEKNYKADEIVEVAMLPIEDYNRMEGKTGTLAPDEIYIYSVTGKWGKDTVKLGSKTYRVAKELENMKIESKNVSRITEGYYFVFSDQAQMRERLEEAYAGVDLEEDMAKRLTNVGYEIAFDLIGEKEDCLRAMRAMRKRMENEIPNGYSEGREFNRESFYNTYGALLFIGIYLGALFLTATVLIIYYKQISEGYDDRQRYQIMQKVGMSKKEVKDSIKSQVRIVFFLPLAAAVVHVAMAFGVITKLLALLNLYNIPLFFGCTAATVAVFAVFYAAVFVLTAREYYKIVD